MNEAYIRAVEETRRRYQEMLYDITLKELEPKKNVIGGKVFYSKESMVSENDRKIERKK